jgi:uncharacterized protein (TIGR03435 family)
MRAVYSICVTILACCVANSQPGNVSPTFDAASVKPAPPPTPAIRNHINTGGPGTADPGRVDWWSVSMIGFLMEAYDVKPYQISGPDWISTEKFQLTATVPKGATKEQYRLMLQNLLAERFRMKMHFEKKESAVYALVVGKGGPKLKEPVDDPSSPQAAGPPATAAEMEKDPDGFWLYPWLHDVMGTGTINGRSRLRGNHATMAQLIAKIKFMLNLPVWDETGLTGTYDFALTYSQSATMAAAAAQPPDGSTANAVEAEVAAAPDLIGAMSQIGLRLEQKKEPIDIVVIDHLEKIPTEN